MIRPSLTLAVLSLLTPTPSVAQQATMDVAKHAVHHPMTPVQDSVLNLAKRLFDGMRARDTAMIRGTFAAGAQLSAVPAAGRPVRYTTVDAFLASIAGAPAGTLLDEQIYDPEIRIDGGLATVWTFFTFTLGDKLSHCGYDAFQLVRTSDGWKITALADTRQSTGCEVTGKKKA